MYKHDCELFHFHCNVEYLGFWLKVFFLVQWYHPMLPSSCEKSNLHCNFLIILSIYLVYFGFHMCNCVVLMRASRAHVRGSLTHTKFGEFCSCFHLTIKTTPRFSLGWANNINKQKYSTALSWTCLYTSQPKTKTTKQRIPLWISDLVQTKWL